MSNLIPVTPPDLRPLVGSFEESQIESELKKVFIAVFESMVRERERTLNPVSYTHLTLPTKA